MEYQIKWHTKNKDGITETERLGHLGLVPDEPEIEQGSGHILRWFYELNAKRQAGFSSPLPISFTEMEAWIRATGKIVWPDEVEVLAAMDSAYLSAVADFSERQKESKG